MYRTGHDVDNIDISDWTNNQDRDSHKKRADIIRAIMKNCRKKHLRTIVDSGWDVNEILDIDLLYKPIPRTAIHEAVKILSHRANRGGFRWDTKSVNRTALHEAASRGWTEGVKILLDAGAKCMKTGALQNILALALKNQDCPPDLISLLLKHGADPNGDNSGNIPLLNAIRNQKRDTIILQLLLEHGANPNLAHRVNIGGRREDKWVNRTALHEAASQGWTEGVKILLDDGAKCIKTRALQNILALALENHNCPPDLITLLLKHGADPNGDNSGNIPLLNAIRNQKTNTIILQLLLEHGANPNIVYRVNIGGIREDKWVHRTVLHEAAIQGWTKVVQMLLDAGAKCKMSGGVENPLKQALMGSHCSPDLIELLLKHGADPNYYITDRDIPLSCAINNIKNKSDLSKIVRLMLEHGANPNVAYIKLSRGQPKHRTALHEAVELEWTEVVKILLDAGAKCVTSDALENPLTLALWNQNCPPDLIDLLLKHGADTVAGDRSWIVRGLSRYIFQDHRMFLQHLLDSFFLNGGNINMEYGDEGTALEYVVRECAHSNSVRWLIRHGSDTALKFTLLKGHFMQSHGSFYPDTPLILLQAGMRVSHGAQTQLSNMEVAISTWLQDNDVFNETMQGMWSFLEEAEEVELQIKQWKKTTFPEYWTQQVVDLKAFSDESLHVYPEDTYISFTDNTRKGYQIMLDQIRRVLEFLSQPQSLQWHCRLCVRENLLSLQPSVVKTLPGPSRLKRYILCHEI